MIAGRVIVHIARPIVKVLFPYKVYGKENVPTKEECPRLVVCCNHISMIDPVFLLVGQKRHIRFMSKAELFRNPILAWFFGKVIGAFAVERGKGDSNAIQVAKDIVEEGYPMGIFPEGTRSKDGQLGRAKSGAALITAQTGATVLPVAVVAKDQKVKIFRKSKVVFGKPMSLEELHLQDPEAPELRFASRAIMQRIGELIEEGKKL